MNLNEPISLFFKGTDHKIGEIVVDAFLRETHELRSEVTEHPLESGSNFVDHVYNLPITLHIEGIFSNTPMTLTGLTVINTINASKDNDKAQKTFTEIKKIFAKREPITISTSLKDYKDMVLESLSVERGGGDFLRFSCTAKQIKTASIGLIKIPEPKVKRAQHKKSLGKQPVKALPKEDIVKVEAIKKETSFLRALFK